MERRFIAPPPPGPCNPSSSGRPHDALSRLYIVLYAASREGSELVAGLGRHAIVPGTESPGSRKSTRRAERSTEAALVSVKQKILWGYGSGLRMRPQTRKPGKML